MFDFRFRIDLIEVDPRAVQDRHRNLFDDDPKPPSQQQQHLRSQPRLEDQHPQPQVEIIVVTVSTWGVRNKFQKTKRSA